MAIVGVSELTEVIIVFEIPISLISSLLSSLFSSSFLLFPFFFPPFSVPFSLFFLIKKFRYSFNKKIAAFFRRQCNQDTLARLGLGVTQ